MIDYLLLHKSTVFYESIGFQRIETPWTVTKEVSAITKPIGSKEFEIIGKDKVLVASAEQGFLYLYLKGFLPKGRFQSISPCFRDEAFDKTHTKYFMKNELINTIKTTDSELNHMIDNCKIFFETNLEANVDIVKTEVGYDIEYKGVEIGSYGIRECEYLRWIYGTGLAEPRFSSLKNSLI